MSLKIGHVGSKARSLSQILQNAYILSKGQIFSLILMEHDHNFYLNDISGKFENGSSWGKKTGSLDQLLEKPCVRSRSHNFCSIILKFDQNICFDDFLDEFENASY